MPQVPIQHRKPGPAEAARHLRRGGIRQRVVRRIAIDECVFERGHRCTSSGEEFIPEEESQRLIKVARRLGIWGEPLKLRRKLSRSGRGTVLRIPTDIERSLALRGDEDVSVSKAGRKIIFCSGREDKYQPETIRFIEKYCLLPGPKGDRPIEYQLFMRKSDDMRKDSIIKEEIYVDNIEGQYNVLCVLDDRDQVVQFWRERGLTCFQVAPGNF